MWHSGMTVDEISEACELQRQRDLATAKSFRNFYQRQVDELEAKAPKKEILCIGTGPANNTK